MYPFDHICNINRDLPLFTFENLIVTWGVVKLLAHKGLESVSAKIFRIGMLFKKYEHFDECILLGNKVIT